MAPLGELLCADRPGAQRGAMLARGQVYYAALGGLLAAVRSGGVPFESVHGERFFTHLAAHPELVGAFQASMRDRSAREAAAVVASYDFAVFGTVVDVGGGGGVLLKAILDAAPGVSGVLFDRPEVAAKSPLPAVAGDFFVEVPAGADAYLLSRVIHDWSDADAVAILRTCRRAMGDSARLLLVEAELPERAADHPAAIRMDLHMLALLGGRERTRAEYAALLAEADLRLTSGRARRPGVGRARVRGPPRLTGQCTSTTIRVRGPWTPSTRSSSMSLVADGPLMKVSGRSGVERGEQLGDGVHDLVGAHDADVDVGHEGEGAAALVGRAVEGDGAGLGAGGGAAGDDGGEAVQLGRGEARGRARRPGTSRRAGRAAPAPGRAWSASAAATTAGTSSGAASRTVAR